MTLLHHTRVQDYARRFLLCRVEGVPDRFSLTFDDGPSPRNTPRLLELLERERARATFFVLGRHVRRAPALLREMVAAGHEIGLHGDGHWPLPLLHPAESLRQWRRAEDSIQGAAGVTPRLYRPPFGWLHPSQAALVTERGYRAVLGDVYPEDPRRPGVDVLIHRVMTRLTGGSILILHDASALGDLDRGQTIEAVEQILERARARGMTAVSVGELVAAAVPPTPPAPATPSPSDRWRSPR